MAHRILQVVRCSSLIWAFLLLCTPLFGEQSCHTNFTRLAKKAIYHSVALPVRAAYHAGKALFYPVAGPIDIAARVGHQYFHKNSKRPVRAIVERLVKDIPHIVLFGALWLGGQGTHISIAELDSASDAAFGPPPPGPVLLVDGYGPSDIFSVSNYVESRSKRYPNAHIIRPVDSGDFLKQLKEFSLEHGPIAKLEYYAHGQPGETAYTQHFGIWSDELAKTGAVSVDNNVIDPRGIFAKDAQVEFVSCSFGAGMRGDNFCNSFHSVMLVPNGGGNVAIANGTVFTTPLEILAAALGAAPPPKCLQSFEGMTEKPSVVLLSLFKGWPYFAPGPLTGTPWVANGVKTTQSSDRFVEFRKRVKISEDSILEPVVARLNDFDRGLGNVILTEELTRESKQQLNLRLGRFAKTELVPMLKSIMGEFEMGFTKEYDRLKHELDRGELTAQQFQLLTVELKEINKATKARLADRFQWEISKFRWITSVSKIPDLD